MFACETKLATKTDYILGKTCNGLDAQRSEIG